jgi:hypothetical protein
MICNVCLELHFCVLNPTYKTNFSTKLERICTEEAIKGLVHKLTWVCIIKLKSHS